MIGAIIGAASIGLNLYQGYANRKTASKNRKGMRQAIYAEQRRNEQIRKENVKSLGLSFAKAQDDQNRGDIREDRALRSNQVKSGFDVNSGTLLDEQMKLNDEQARDFIKLRLNQSYQGRDALRAYEDSQRALANQAMGINNSQRPKTDWASVFSGLGAISDDAIENDWFGSDTTGGMGGIMSYFGFDNTGQVTQPVNKYQTLYSRK